MGNETQASVRLAPDSNLGYIKSALQACTTTALTAHSLYRPKL